ncbi:MAG: hypothetical protein ACU843_13380 [Gammaproteobacteria bacterium]
MQDLVENAIHEALGQLLRADAELLHLDANERSISHRLAGYLETFFPGWNVDCEYNRDGYDPKRLNIQPRGIQSDDTQATTVFPDIIIHRRGTNDNLVVIEMKKTTSQEDDEYDLQKLRAFKNQLGYQFAIFVKVATDRAADIKNLRWI